MVLDIEARIANSIITHKNPQLSYVCNVITDHGTELATQVYFSFVLFNLCYGWVNILFHKCVVLSIAEIKFSGSNRAFNAL